MKFISVQTGARRGYAVPAILEKARMLERFYTDMAGNAEVGRLLSRCGGIPALGPHLRRLAGRAIPPEILAKTRTFPSRILRERISSVISPADPTRCFIRNIETSRHFGNAMIRAGFGNATHVYSMLSEAGPFMAEAHRRGLTVVSEVYILLSTERILAEERRAFPDWEPDAPDYVELRRRHIKEDVLMERTHFYICPSEAVLDDLVENWGVDRERTALVPYGMHPRWLDIEPQPRPGRVLFVGTADLRKGIHYLAMAADRLNARGFRYEFRVAGAASDQVRRQSVCRHLNFLGRVPRDRIHEEFQQADLFVLPSLAEGSAEVTYEALAAGVPLVVTPAAGSVARDGIEGRIVPERDPAALADAIEQVVVDRSLRDRLAYHARERARDFTWEKYGERLLVALNSFKEKPSVCV